MSTAKQSESIGTTDCVLVDRYRLEALIGAGAAGSVYRARDLLSGERCAIKRMKATKAIDEQDRQRFINEGTHLAQLCHPSIVAVREFHVEKGGSPLLVMELLEGEDLLALLQRRGRLPLAQVLDILSAVGSALHAAHSVDIIHRDIKPSNIFLCRPTGQDALLRQPVKIIDFGIAKSPGLAQPQTAHGLIIGTPQYLAPESTYAGPRCIDGRVDQWALAVVAYRMLTGCLPFEDPDPVQLIMKIRRETPAPLSRLAPGLPEPVYLAIEKALAKKPAERFASVPAFTRALRGKSLSMQPAGESLGVDRIGRAVQLAG